jgi:hypothetical protein
VGEPQSENRINTLESKDKQIAISGKIIKIARMQEEWLEDIEDPETILNGIKESKNKVDIFSFMQRLPDIEPKHRYPIEWENLAAIEIIDYEYWWNKQIKKKIRENVRKAKKRGVVVKLVEFSDELVEGIVSIFNETPIRRGKPFSHYGKDFEYIKKTESKDLHRVNFIGAYYNEELIGFIKLINAGTYARTSGTVSKIAHRDKPVMNALIAKAVEICCNNKYPYLVYGKYIYGKKGKDSLTEFKRRNGFRKIDLPRYYIPLNYKGKIALRLKLHKGIFEFLPDKIITRLINMRSRYYNIMKSI